MFKMFRNTLLIIFYLIGFHLSAQNKISTVFNNKTSNLPCAQNATYENINGKINISIITNDGQLLELNNIDENQFKCGNKMNSLKPKIVLIHEKKNQTWVSNSSINISIKCKGVPNEYLVFFSGLIKNKKQKMYLSCNLQVKSKPKKHLTIN
jgi:hypothetical protein